MSGTNKMDKYLLTPGPLTTSMTVKEAMLRDFGSRDPEFIKMNADVRELINAIPEGQGTHTCVLLQGSGTFVVEAALGTLLPREGKLLILINGAYGHRMKKMCGYIGRKCEVIETPEDVPCDIKELDACLSSDDSITHVAMVHCETTTGILNPLREASEIVAKHGRSFILDCMSSFGAIPISLKEIKADALLASSNKCLEGSPGIGLAILRTAALEKCKGNAHSLSLDLYDQWQGFNANAQWRFTPPTHVLASLRQALAEHQSEGGVAGRGARYKQNCKILVEGMRKIGFVTLLPDNLQAPIIVTFHQPKDPKFNFEKFYQILSNKNYLIYPGKLTVADTFRMGCIGRLGKQEMEGAINAVQEAVDTLGLKNLKP